MLRMFVVLSIITPMILGLFACGGSSPAAFPSGKMVFVTSRDRIDEIYVMNTDGSNQQRLTNNSATDRFPAWSPDGFRIAFMSERDGNHGIYAMDADGSSPINLTNNLANDMHPAWSTGELSETVSTPNTPSGPSSGEVDQSMSYSTGGSTSSKGDSVQYRFDWGDESYSDWSSSTSASHSWSSEGTYTVRAQARCSTHTSITSGWSSGKSVNACIPAMQDIVVVVEGLDFKEFWDDVDDVVRGLPDNIIDSSVLLAALSKLDLEFEFGNEEDYLADELRSAYWSVSHFEWDRDASFTDTHVNELKALLTDEYAKAQCSGKKLIVVSHSWGTFLTYAALSKLAEDGSPVMVDVYITLSSPLGTYWAPDWYDPIITPTAFAADYVVASYVERWWKELKLRVDPNVGRWVNYWAWGDIISGPVANVYSWVEDRQIDPPSQLYGDRTRGLRAIDNSAYWHKYTSLNWAEDIRWENRGLKDKVGYIVMNTIDGEYVSSEYTADILRITLSCPVDMIVTDPDGLTISRDLSEIAGAFYVETDLNRDGDPDDQVIIQHKKEGDYQIAVMREPDALPTDEYSLRASIGDDTTIVVEKALVSDIPDQPYVINVRVPGPPDGSSNMLLIIIPAVFGLLLIAASAFLIVNRRRRRQQEAQ